MKLKTRMVTILVSGFLLAGLFLPPLSAAAGMQVTMKVDGMI